MLLKCLTFTPINLSSEIYVLILLYHSTITSVHKVFQLFPRLLGCLSSSTYSFACYPNSMCFHDQMNSPLMAMYQSSGWAAARSSFVLFCQCHGLLKSLLSAIHVCVLDANELKAEKHTMLSGLKVTLIGLWVCRNAVLERLLNNYRKICSFVYWSKEAEI